MINNFNWNFSTNVIFGACEEENIGKYCKEYGNRVLIVHSGSNRQENLDLIRKICVSLENAGISYIEQTGIKPNPTIDTVRDGILKFREFNGDMILAVGGGSAIDTAKAISFGVHYDGDVWDMFIGKSEVSCVVPVGAVLTIAAAGSEGSSGTVITNSETNQKFDVINPKLQLKFVVMNPELTLSLPEFQTACGVLDIVSHAMERYFTDTNNVELTDMLGEAVMKCTINNGLKLMENSKDLVARSQIMWASTLAHNGLLEGGRNGCWASHQMATEISAYYDISHGATLSVITPAWMKYIYKADIARFARFATEVFGIKCDDLQATAEKGIEAFEDFCKKMKMPTKMSEIGILDDEKIEIMAKSATRFAEIGCIMKLKMEDVINIYRLAM